MRVCAGGEREKKREEGGRRRGFTLHPKTSGKGGVTTHNLDKNEYNSTKKLMI